MDNPKCPICGSPMNLKTAKRGSNAGKQFYGCSLYPNCNGIVNNQSESIDKSIKNDLSIPSTKFFLPRVFIARQRSEQLQVRFFQSIAVSASVLEDLIKDELSNQLLRAFTQWRLDFPKPINQPNWTEQQRQVLAVAEKILTRGHLTLCSPKLESLYVQKFIGNYSSIKVKDKMLVNPIIKINLDFWLDSDPERFFYEKYLPNKFGTDFLQWVTPQVELNSLLSVNDSPQATGRVDFLICHPSKQPVIVEIDGEHHSQQQKIDSLRDQALCDEGYVVIRIPSTELESLNGPNLLKLEKIFTSDKSELNDVNLESENMTRFINAVKIAHQIQLSILQAIQSGFLELIDSSNWYISTDLNRTSWLSDEDALFVVKNSIDDLIEFIQNIGRLYSIEICKGTPNLYHGDGSTGIHISFTGENHSILTTFFIQNISVPFDIANTIFISSPAVIDSPSEKTLEFFLNYIFRKSCFREGQFDAISRTLQHKDSIVLLPTGAGKSIAFQLASLLLPGRTIVIDPIISLMEDQIDNLQMVGIDRAIAITSHISDPQDRSKVLSLLGQGEYLFAYIAPERFQTIEFRQSLRRLTTHTPISLIAIDEAHCVSEWGHDFRTAYLNIGRISREYCESNGIVPPLLALTGTASRAVLKDIQRELQIEDFDAIITPKSFDRPELKFQILKSSSSEKFARLLGYIQQQLPSKFEITPTTFFQSNGKATFSGLIFCHHVDGEFGVVQIAGKIRESLKVDTAFYSGKEPKFYSSYDWNNSKQKVARQFKHNKIPLLVCTKAFGMGIDKPNIRYTIHYGIPPSIESFYQEAGRAGRDGKPAQCCIILSVDNEIRTNKLLDPNTTPEEISLAVKTLDWNDNDDITRLLFFQTKSFPGFKEEKHRVGQIINTLTDLSTKSTKSIRMPDLGIINTEKALYRLVVLGIVSDYTINYNNEEFTVKLSGATKESIINSYVRYVAGYIEARSNAEREKANKLLQLKFNEFVISMVDLLLHFIYDVIEKGRRRALYEMLIVAIESPNDDSVRQRILRYLETTHYSEALEAILAQSDAGIDKTIETFEAVCSPNEATELRGQVARYLESYPDHPGLLMLRSLAEVYSRERNSEIVKQNFFASISYAEVNYSLEQETLLIFASWAIIKISQRDIKIAQDLQIDMLQKYPLRMFARKLVEKSSPEFASIPAWFLVGNLAKRSKELIS